MQKHAVLIRFALAMLRLFFVHRAFVIYDVTKFISLVIISIRGT